MSNDSSRKPRTHYQDKDHPFDNMDNALDIGDVDQNGNKHPDHERYENEMEQRYIGKDKPKVEHHNDDNEIDGQVVPF